MTYNDYRLKEDEIKVLFEMKGKIFDSFFADSAFGCTKSIRNALFSVDNNFYCFENKLASLDYYGTESEDVAIFSLMVAKEDLLNKEKNFPRTTEIPIKQQIKDIEIITEDQKVYENEVLKYETNLTRGVIFYFDDGYELSFEKDIWFSEIIKIQRGYNLIEKFTPTAEFEEDWASNFRANCTRIVEKL